MLMGYGGLELAKDIPANHFVTFKGGKASASKGVGLTIHEALELYEPDALRYALAANIPEQSDTEISEEEIARRINDELVATWGNLVNRVLSMTAANFDSTVPEAGELDDDDRALLDSVDAGLTEVAARIEKVELRAGLRAAMEAAQEVNAYLNAKAPWKTAKTDLARTATTLKVAIDAINGLKVAFSPYLPRTAGRIHSLLGLAGAYEDAGWSRETVPSGTALPPVEPLFKKIE